MHPFFAMLVSVMYTSKTVKLKFLIVSKIFRNPGKLTLCWLKKNSTTRIASGAEQDNIEKKEKAIAFPIFARGNRWAYRLPLFFATISVFRTE